MQVQEQRPEVIAHHYKQVKISERTKPDKTCPLQDQSKVRDDFSICFRQLPTKSFNIFFSAYWLIGPLVIGNKLLRITSNSQRSSLWKFLHFKCVFKRAPPVQHRNQDSYLLQTTQDFFYKKIMMCWNNFIVKDWK